jgi:hypothetical protein
MGSAACRTASALMCSYSIHCRRRRGTTDEEARTAKAATGRERRGAARGWERGGVGYAYLRRRILRASVSVLVLFARAAGVGALERVRAAAGSGV